MYYFEAAKSKLEQITGVARLSARQVKKHIRKRKPLAVFFDDNGYVPNNPKFPFLHYRNVVSLTEAVDPAAVFNLSSRPMVGSVHGETVFTITFIFIRARMRSLASPADERVFGSAAIEERPSAYAWAMLLSYRRERAIRPYRRVKIFSWSELIPCQENTTNSERVPQTMQKRYA